MTNEERAALAQRLRVLMDWLHAERPAAVRVDKHAADHLSHAAIHLSAALDYVSPGWDQEGT